MNTPPQVSPCLLTDQGGGRYTSAPGLLTLALVDRKGNTTFDCANSTVSDLSGTQPLPVEVDCKETTFAFTVVKTKKYEIKLVFIQQPSPFVAVANLVETPCEKNLLQIDKTTPTIVLRVTA